MLQNRNEQDQYEPVVPIPLLAQFHAGTIISTTTWWLENDMPCSSREMAHYVSLLIADGRHGIMQNCTAKGEL